MGPKKQLGLFIPVYNAESLIERVLQSIPNHLISKFQSVLVVDNNSSDQTLDKALRAINQRPSYPFELYRNCENYLLGGSTILAFELAFQKGLDFLICYHGDGQASVTDLEKMVELCEASNADFILGSRLLKQSRIESYSLLRALGNRFISQIQKLLFRCEAKDLGAFIAFNLRTVEKLNYRSIKPDMGYHPNLILYAFKVSRRRILVEEFPISWGAAEISHVNPLFYATEHLFKLVRLRFFDKQISDALEHKEYLSERIFPSHLQPRRGLRTGSNGSFEP